MGTRNSGSDNDSYFDDLFVKIDLFGLGCEQLTLNSDAINRRPISLKVYPNPFYDILYLEKKERIVVRDILGKIIYSSSNVNLVQTSNWDTGVYFISLKDKNQTIKVIKIK